MKNIRKMTALLLALVMVFAVSATAFAAENAATPGLYVNGKPQNVTIQAGDNVAKIVKDAFPEGTASTWSGDYLRSLTIDGQTYASDPYVADPSCFDADGKYIGGDDLLSSITEHGGVAEDFSDLAPGYYSMKDGSMLYLGSDWTFKVDYNDGKGPVTPGEPREGWYDGFYQYTMVETVLDGDEAVYLEYGFVPTFF